MSTAAVLCPECRGEGRVVTPHVCDPERPRWRSRYCRGLPEELRQETMAQEMRCQECGGTGFCQTCPRCGEWRRWDEQLNKFDCDCGELTP